MPIVNLSQILTFAAEKGASDIHFQVGAPPLLRHHGELFPLKHAPLSEEDMVAIGQTLAKYADAEKFKQELRDYDGSFALANVARFRVNVFRQNGRYAAVLRLIPFKPRTFQELNLPKVLEKIASLKRGLILVTGATGNGKSTTLAAIINHINQKRRAHIITIEDPIEYIHQHKKCIVNQREIGNDTLSFTAALKYVLRQDPDVILIGEMRDRETIAAALTIAETGHLAMATLHTNSTFESINRIIDVFPPEQQNQVRSQLAFCLSGVLTQQLIPRAYGRGRVLVMEIMVCTTAIKAMIRDNKVHQIYGIMQAGQKHGMQTMNQSLYQAFANKWISRDQALSRSTDPAEMLQMMGEPVGAV